jgi:hypothetical protein
LELHNFVELSSNAFGFRKPSAVGGGVLTELLEI